MPTPTHFALWLVWIGSSTILGFVPQVLTGACDWSRESNVSSRAAAAPLLVVADLDEDGQPDSASSHAEPRDSIEIRLSRGGRLEMVPAAGIVVGLAAGDVDRDGDVDLVALSRSGSLDVLANTGRGGFASPQRHKPRPDVLARGPGLTTGRYVFARPVLPGSNLTDLIGADLSLRVPSVARTRPADPPSIRSTHAWNRVSPRGPPALGSRA